MIVTFRFVDKKTHTHQSVEIMRTGLGIESLIESHASLRFWYIFKKGLSNLSLR